jgi:hypothetical protein
VVLKHEGGGGKNNKDKSRPNQSSDPIHVLAPTLELQRPTIRKATNKQRITAVARPAN